MRKLSKNAKEDTKGLVRMLQTLVEILVMTALYFLVWRLADPGGAVFGFLHKGKYVLMGVYALLLLLVFQNSDCTMFGQLRLPELFIGQFIALGMVNFITYFQVCLIAKAMLSPLPMLVLLGVELVAAGILLLVYQKIYCRIYRPHDMLLIYGSKQSLVLKLKMDGRPDKYHIGKFLPADADRELICREIEKHDSVVLNEVPAETRNWLMNYCYARGIRTYVAPELTDIMLQGAECNKLFDVPLLMVKGSGLTPGQRIVKRTMDILLSSIALLLASPFMLGVALAIKIEDRGPVFFKQKRLTRWGREFEILKFRSMIVDAEKYAGAVLATENDPRITKVGRFIRATRLDELPQLLNILKGDMSVVGPRPERKILADEIKKEVPEFDYRLKVRGGLTGYAQIFGKYNTSAYDKLRLDVMYIENYSLLLDLRLIILTLRIIFSKDSTEGVDVAKENERLAEELLEKAKQEE